MAKSSRSTPGDHLLDCLFAPRAALEAAAKQEIPLLETAAVAAAGMTGLGWALSGLLVDGNAFERFVLGGLQGLALGVPLLLFVGAANALQPPGGGPATTAKQSAAVVATGLVAPGVVALVCGLGSLIGPMFVTGDLVALVPAVLAGITWLLGLVGMTGIGHALGRGTSAVMGVLSAAGALLITAFVVGLAVAIWMNPPWASEQPWGFL
jgi:hypothetical protein